MKIKVHVGRSNRFRLNEKIADDFEVNNGDIFEMDFGKNQILLTKVGQREE